MHQFFKQLNIGMLAVIGLNQFHLENAIKEILEKYPNEYIAISNFLGKENFTLSGILKINLKTKS